VRKSAFGVIVFALACLLGVAGAARFARPRLATYPLAGRPLVRRLLGVDISFGLVSVWVACAGVTLWIISRL
jgi:hypothetical protein